MVELMLSLRFLLTLAVIALGMLGATSPVSAQQGYGFGIRFQPVNFRPVNFGGFSFQQTSFRPVNTQPIQFDRITFPSFSSRAVRQNAIGRDLRQRQVESGFVAGRRLRNRRFQPLLSSGSGRVSLAASDLPSRQKVIGRSPYTSQTTRFARSTDSLRVARSVGRTLEPDRLATGERTAGLPVSRVRREVVARRFDGAPSRVNRLAGDVRSARLAGRALLVR